MKYRYVIHCARMPREEAFYVESFTELVKLLEQYVDRFGPIDLLYNVGRV